MCLMIEVNKTILTQQDVIVTADSKVELYSTDRVLANAIQLVGDDYTTNKCYCRIQDMACSICGNIVGYHVTMPCKSCMQSCNNGHFWIYHAQAVNSSSRLNDDGSNMSWEELTNSNKITTLNESPHSFILCGR
ncbi:Protein FAM72B [Trichoplax sp. H2]|nr:Protein FAM72B [Trichoplax sp. H2]|eukprot:RDD43846.1 Protein FAM72B [Trichoplax sp. H2]